MAPTKGVKSMAIAAKFRYALDYFGWTQGEAVLTVGSSPMQQFPVLFEIRENGQLFTAGGLWNLSASRVDWTTVWDLQHPLVDMLSRQIASHFDAAPTQVVANRSDTRDHRWWKAAVSSAGPLKSLLEGRLAAFYTTQAGGAQIREWAKSIDDWRPAFPGSDLYPLSIFRCLPAGLHS